jgi:hypothetical protein
MPGVWHGQGSFGCSVIGGGAPADLSASRWSRCGCGSWPGDPIAHPFSRWSLASGRDGVGPSPTGQ